MNETIIVDMLSNESVSVLRIEYAQIEGITVEVSRSRKAYVNCLSGRTEVNVEVAEPYLNAILSVWGSTPVIAE